MIDKLKQINWLKFIKELFIGVWLGFVSLAIFYFLTVTSIGTLAAFIYFIKTHPESAANISVVLRNYMQAIMFLIVSGLTYLVWQLAKLFMKKNDKQY